MHLFAVLMTLILTLPLSAQERDIPTNTTVVRLQADASREVAQDTLHATLHAEARADNPRKVQTELNLVMRKALALTRGTSAISVTTGSYRVHELHRPVNRQTGERVGKPEWQASQSLQLKARDFTLLLERVADLQESGLRLNDLSFSLSPAVREQIQDELLTDALTELQSRAAVIGTSLNKPQIMLAEVNVNSSGGHPPILHRAARMETMALSADMPTPSAQAGEDTVTVHVQATIWLQD